MTRRNWRNATPLLAAVLVAGFTCAPVLADGLQALPGTYSATITDWPMGKTGTVTLEHGLASGTVDAQGRFSIVLPGLANNENLRRVLVPVSSLFADHPDIQCSGKGLATPDTGASNEFYLYASVAGAAPIRLNLYADGSRPGATDGFLQFLDTATTFQGVVTCKDSATTYRAAFPAGWSLNLDPVQDIDAGTGLATSTISDQLPVAATWHLSESVPRIGIQLAEVAAGSAGPVIDGVTPGSPAEGAGVQVNDLLVEVDGKSVAGLNRNQVVARVRGTAGTVVTLGVLRGAETTVRRIQCTRTRLQQR